MIGDRLAEGGDKLNAAARGRCHLRTQQLNPASASLARIDHRRMSMSKNLIGVLGAAHGSTHARGHPDFPGRDAERLSGDHASQPASQVSYLRRVRSSWLREVGIADKDGELIAAPPRNDRA